MRSATHAFAPDATAVDPSPPLMERTLALGTDAAVPTEVQQRSVATTVIARPGPVAAIGREARRIFAVAPLAAWAALAMLAAAVSYRLAPAALDTLGRLTHRG